MLRTLHKLKLIWLKIEKRRLTTREEECTGDNLDEADKQHVFGWLFLVKFFQLYVFLPKCKRSVASKNPKLDAPFKYLLRFQRVSSGARNIWWPMLTHFSSDYVNDTGFLPPETDSPRNSSSMLAGFFSNTSNCGELNEVENKLSAAEKQDAACHCR